MRVLCGPRPRGRLALGLGGRRSRSGAQPAHNRCPRPVCRDSRARTHKHTKKWRHHPLHTFKGNNKK
eukprot:7390410-Prymnesium_polylepis.3